MKLFSSKYPVSTMSRKLGVSTSGYYRWVTTEQAREDSKAQIESEIKTAYHNSFETYGSPRIATVLQSKNIKCSKSTVARRMQSLRISARAKKKYVTTTNSDHNHKIAENLLGREFAVSELNTVWVSDITYVRVNNNWMYLTTMLDLADRMIVGWSLSDDMTTSKTVNAAFKKAVTNRNIQSKSNLMIHSDRGVQYASKEFRSLLAAYGCIQSMSRKGNCWDNAVAESFFKTIKAESLNKYNFNNADELKKVLFRYIDGWYNTVRIHSSLGGISPLRAFLEKSIKLAA